MEYVKKFDDYEVLDCGDSYKIERFGKFILKRPDPQAIWHMNGKKAYKLNAKYHRSNTGGGEWEFFDLPKSWKIKYEFYDNEEIVFNLKPYTFKHTGIFPEQSVNWDFMYKKIKDELKTKKEFNVLNLFAYTGGASLACAKAGAKVVHVDAAKGMIELAKENALDSNLPNDMIRWITDDCKKFVKREIRREHFYDAVILDPPSYGRGPNGEVWKIENDIYDFLIDLSYLLNKNSSFLVFNSYTTGLQSSALNYMVSDIFKNKFGGEVYATEIGIKVSSTSLILPEGATCRWTR